MNENHFIEFEHKFILDDHVDIESFHSKINALHPEKNYKVDVEDTYYIPTPPHHVYRHRRDVFLNQLTYKSTGEDSEKRLEVNLDLAPTCTPESVELFLSANKTLNKVTIHKKVHVYYFKDVEIVIYKAHLGERSVCCLEIEVRHFTNDQSAKATLSTYENALGLSSQNRVTRSLLEILSSPQHYN